MKDFVIGIITIAAVTALFVFIIIRYNRQDKSDKKEAINSWATIGVIIFMLLLLGYCKLTTPAKEQYEDQWHSELNNSILITLGKNNAHGCAEVYYKQSQNISGEYLVKCVGDKNKETYYLVFPNVEKLTGPIQKP